MFSCNIDIVAPLFTHILAHTRGVVDRLGQHLLQHSASDSRLSVSSHPQALAVCLSRGYHGLRDAIANQEPASIIHGARAGLRLQVGSGSNAEAILSRTWPAWDRLSVVPRTSSVPLICGP